MSEDSKGLETKPLTFTLCKAYYNLTRSFGMGFGIGKLIFEDKQHWVM